MSPVAPVDTGGELTADAVAGYAYDAGFRGDGLTTIVAIAGAESGWNYFAFNGVAPDRSFGLLQINMFGALGPDRISRYHLSDETDLYEPAVNMAAGYDISGGGTNFGPWSTFTNGAYRAYLDQARAAAVAIQSRGGIPGISQVVAGVGAVGDGTSLPGFAGTPAAPTPGPPTADYLPDALKLQPPSSTWVPSRFIDGFKVEGKFIEGDVLGAAAFAGHMDLTTDQVSQVDLQFAEPRAFDLAARFPLRTAVEWYDLELRVAEKKWGPGAGGAVEQLTVTCRSDGAEKMREYDALGRSLVFTDMSPTELLNERASVAGLRFIGKGTVRRTQITRHGKGDTHQDQTESDWDLGQRLAKEEGFWAFEAAGVYYFAPPSWLISRMPRFNVTYSPSPPALSEGLGDGLAGAVPSPGVEPVECPDADISSDDKPGQTDVRTLGLKLTRDIGEQVRPGMGIDFAGIPGWERDADFDGRYLVTRVSWDLDGGTTPATIDATQPVDPIPEPPTNDVTDDTSPTGAPRFTPTLVGGPSALDFVTLCLKQVGDAYVMGAGHSPGALADPDPNSFDCSGLIGWACAQLGVDFGGTAGSQMTQVINSGLEISIDQAKTIRGAVLYRGTLTNPGNEHIVVSLGDGVHTVEAMGTNYGVVEGDIGNRFTRAGLIPGLDYGVVRGSVGGVARRS